MTRDEMVLREETNEFEDLCKKCIKASHDGDDTIEIEVEIGLIKEKYTWEE
jgi:hypothetical protein